ncbi:hypothetical protein Salat_0279500 [Sesamum alatum]|uniref:Uncharacterized protein n=1 Tax=Sesamum alatum TaxID=300844 RepID=A0AAE2CYM6_9LAMI|nr:hypothetical protein Salat_0279500 [Sesamum alatum]
MLLIRSLDLVGSLVGLPYIFFDPPLTRFRFDQQTGCTCTHYFKKWVCVERKRRDQEGKQGGRTLVRTWNVNIRGIIYVRRSAWKRNACRHLCSFCWCRCRLPFRRPKLLNLGGNILPAV